MVGAIRCAAALPVLRWQLAGALLAIAVDLADLALFSYLSWGWPPDYQAFDKVADLALLATMLAASRRWSDPERRVSALLFAVRLAGVALFELGHVRWLLLVFPNVFEFWFVFVAARDRLWPGAALGGRRAAVILGLLTALKIGQEYLLHVDRRLDSYALTDVLKQLLLRLGAGS